MLTDSKRDGKKCESNQHAAPHCDTEGDTKEKIMPEKKYNQHRKCENNREKNNFRLALKR
jgi:hypothetical protein